MITTEINAPIWLPGPLVPRSAGVHLSSIIRCIATEAGILKPEWAEELSLVDARTITDPVAILRISMGLAWEQYYIPTILTPSMGVTDHPGEHYVDGVYMTPDGESLDVIITDTPTGLTKFVHEVKFTYKSTNTVADLKKQWMWKAQLMGYCKALETRHAILHVLFACGDYIFPLKPALKCWRVEFTPEEIEEGWGMMTTYRDEFGVTD